MVADGRVGLRGRQADGRGRKGVVGVDGVGGGRDVVVLRGGRVRRRPHDDEARATTTPSAGLFHSFVVQQLWAKGEISGVERGWVLRDSLCD